MRGFQRVLVPVDFSTGSRLLVETAGRVVGLGGKILLLHVVDFVPVVVEGAFGGYARPHEMRALHEESVQKLDEMKQAHASLPIETEVLEAKTADGIIDAAKRFRAELMVVGTHDDRRIGPFSLGSVTQKLLRHSPCPVLVMPERE